MSGKTVNVIALGIQSTNVLAAEVVVVAEAREEMKEKNARIIIISVHRGPSEESVLKTHVTCWCSVNSPVINVQELVEEEEAEAAAAEAAEAVLGVCTLLDI